MKSNLVHFPSICLLTVLDVYGSYWSIHCLPLYQIQSRIQLFYNYCSFTLFKPGKSFKFCRIDIIIVNRLFISIYCCVITNKDVKIYCLMLIVGRCYGHASSYLSPANQPTDNNSWSGSNPRYRIHIQLWVEIQTANASQSYGWERSSLQFQYKQG